MTQQEKRIKIAQACGFKPLAFVQPKRGEFILEQNNFRRWKKAGKTFHTEDLPDYFNDLNAIHGAVASKGLAYDTTHEKNLADVCDAGDPATDWWESTTYRGFLIHATAAQRAEAFGKTLNLW